MKVATPQPLRPPDRLLATVLALMLVVALATHHAAAAASGFTLAGSDIRNDDDGIYLNARFDVGLSREAEEALESGVPLRLAIEVRVTRPRGWWWWAAELVSEAVYTELRYHALSRRYVVVHEATGERRTFFRRDAALNAWASVAAYRVIDPRRLDPNDHYLLHLRARLDPSRLPYPLRTVALVSPEWRLTSEWYEWPLDG